MFQLSRDTAREDRPLAEERGLNGPSFRRESACQEAVSMADDRHEEIAHCLFNESNDALFLFDPATHLVLDLNPVAMRLTGFTRQIAGRKQVWDLFDSPDPELLRQLVEAYTTSWFYHSREGLFLECQERPPLAVNVSVSRIHTRPDPIGLVVARDISERKRAQETLDRFFRLAPDLFAILDLEDGTPRFARVNPAWTHALGLEARELVGRSLLEFVHDADAPGLEERLTGLVEGHELTGLEARFRHRDGYPRWMSFSVTLDQGAINLVARDVTEARRAAALRHAMGEAERASRAKSDFVFTLGHEIRTPMAAIREHTGQLLADQDFAREKPEAAQAIRTISRSVDQLLELLGDLLDLGRMESGADPIEARACSPFELVSDVIDTMRAWAESRGLELVAVPREPLPALIQSDRVRLRQILINLVSNAIKFTKRGSVRLEYWWDADDPPDRPLHFAVRDTGPGLSQGLQDHMFTPYHRGEVVEHAYGAGLGLAISQRLARLLRGRLQAISQPGEGSSFILSIPVVEVGSGDASLPHGAVRGHDDSQAARPRAEAGLRVLVVDDHDDLRESLILRLEREGLLVTGVARGEEAIEAFREASERGESFDLILLDVLMPGMDGLETARGLRDLGCKCRVIALTAFGAFEESEQCRASGFDAVLEKPLNWNQLIALLPRGLRVS